jgi:hypothetical protein
MRWFLISLLRFLLRGEVLHPPGSFFLAGCQTPTRANASQSIDEPILTHALQLQKYLSLDQKGKVIAEYVWIDSTGGTRSKSRVGPLFFLLTNMKLFPINTTACLAKISASPCPNDGNATGFANNRKTRSGYWRQ